MFNILNNLVEYLNTGLLSPDFEVRTVLQFTGEAEISCDEERVHCYESVERVVEFRLTDVMERPEGTLLRWQFTERSLFNP